jgi:hypothetical protein
VVCLTCPVTWKVPFIKRQTSLNVITMIKSPTLKCICLKKKKNKLYYNIILCVKEANYNMFVSVV